MEKILLIEDDVYLRELYTTVLKTAAYTVLGAADGVEGLSLVQHNTDAKLLLLDILLPKRNGMELLQQLKADPATAGMPVIILTNLSQDDIAKKAMDMGAYAYLIKMGNTNDEIVQKVKECIAFYGQNT